MTNHLWPYLRLKANSEDELKALYRKVYVETYVKDALGKEVKLYDWHGTRVHFNVRTFDHAFSESTDYRFSVGRHNVPFSRRRARCILWIKEVLSASAGTIERYNQTRRDTRGRQRQRRVLLVVEERYVVVLQVRDQDRELEFITAFPGDEGYVRKVKKESGWVETKKPQS